MDWPTIIKKIPWLFSMDISIMDIIQAVLLSFLVFYILKSIYKTRAWVLAKGLIAIGIIYFIIYLSNMTILSSIMDGLINVILIAIVIMLQPDLQKIVERIGTKDWKSLFKSPFKRIKTENLWVNDKGISEIATACQEMGEAKTGALIVIERKIPLKEVIESGIPLRAEITSQLLINTFEKNTPLHDGAVVIKDEKLEAATCYLPLTKDPSVDKHLGTRHRAAIGISESSDAIVIIVSEETGAISLSVEGKIEYDLSKSDLINRLRELCKINNESEFLKNSSKSPMWIKIISPIVGAVLALLILNSTDPIVTQKISNIPVEITNEEALTELAQVYTINGDQTVSVKITGRRSIIDSIDESDFTATADLKEMSMTYAVPIRVSLPQYSNVDIDTDNATINLKLEKLSQIELPVEVQTNGVNNDYLVRDFRPSVDKLTVSGPQSIIDTLDKVVVQIDVTGRTRSFSQKCTPIVYDKNGEDVTKKLTLNSESIDVLATTLPTKDVEVDVQMEKQDTSADEYYVLDSLKLVNNKIKIAASEDVLAKTDKINIIIVPDESTINTTSLTVKISTYLPKNVYLASTQSDELSMELNVHKMKKVSIPLSKNDIKISNIDSKEVLTFIQVPQKIEGYVNTALSKPEDITIQKLNPTFTKKTSSSGSEKLTLDPIDGFIATSDLTVSYKIEKAGSSEK